MSIEQLSALKASLTPQEKLQLAKFLASKLTQVLLPLSEFGKIASRSSREPVLIAVLVLQVKYVSAI